MAEQNVGFVRVLALRDVPKGNHVAYELIEPAGAEIAEAPGMLSRRPWPGDRFRRRPAVFHQRLRQVRSSGPVFAKSMRD